MEGLKSATLPAQVLFYLQFYDEDWNELVAKRTWTNDAVRIATLFDQLRDHLWSLEHGMTSQRHNMHGVIGISVEVMP